MYRVGLIGCGHIAVEDEDSHFKAYKDCPDTQVVALCDIDKQKLKNFTRYHSYTSVIQMVKEENLDIISVCTPVETHKEIVCIVAPFTRALYVEKPIATTL